MYKFPLYFKIWCGIANFQKIYILKDVSGLFYDTQLLVVISSSIIFMAHPNAHHQAHQRENPQVYLRWKVLSKEENLTFRNHCHFGRQQGGHAQCQLVLRCMIYHHIFTGQQNGYQIMTATVYFSSIDCIFLCSL